MKLREFVINYKYRLLLTLLLILMEAGLMLLFPLFIGYAINGVIDGSNLEVYQLGMLGLVLLIVGVGRRVFDSRFYGKIYETIGAKVVSDVKDGKASIKSARLNMLKEFIEFLENALPDLVNSLIGLGGVVLILATLNETVFIGSLIVTVLVFIIYWISSKKTIEFNTEANNEMEAQVDVVASGKSSELKNYLKLVTKWNIKLSDLEAINFSLSWLVAIIFLVVSIIVSTSDGIANYGALFALVMYVFQYIENVLSLPFFYQNWLRLQEILSRFQRA